MDTVYPEPLSRILRRTERRPRGNRDRYRTQPVTFSEIQEVDEENIDDEVETNKNISNPVLMSKSEHDIKTKVDTLFLTATGEARPRKRTMKSLNRLSVERPQPMVTITPSPESPEQCFQRSGNTAPEVQTRPSQTRPDV